MLQSDFPTLLCRRRLRFGLIACNEDAQLCGHYRLPESRVYLIHGQLAYVVVERLRPREGAVAIEIIIPGES